MTLAHSPDSPIEWHLANEPAHYAAIVREAFGSGRAANADVSSYLLPPLTALECIQIEITTWCNFGCQQCSRTKLMAEGKWTNVHISLDTVRKIIEKLPPTRMIYLQGVGEPSMHPQFYELIELAANSKKFHSIHFNTNGHTHDDAYWRSLAPFAGLTVALSVDSLDPVVAPICRSGTDVETLWKRLQLFRETFQWFIVAMVASRLNLHDIETTLRKIAALGNVPVQVTRMMSDDPAVVLRPEDEPALAAAVESVRADFPDAKIYFNSNNSGFPPNEKRCVNPFLNPYVRADGYLTPCCSADAARHYQYTRVDTDDSWDAIRNDSRVTGWVRSFIDEDPEVCRGCSLNPNRSVLLKETIDEQ